MTNLEFEEAIEELRNLWKLYKTGHPSNKCRKYKQYATKLEEVSSKTHISTEDIALYIDRNKNKDSITI